MYADISTFSHRCHWVSESNTTISFRVGIKVYRVVRKERWKVERIHNHIHNGTRCIELVSRVKRWTEQMQVQTDFVGLWQSDQEKRNHPIPP